MHIYNHTLHLDSLFWRLTKFRDGSHAHQLL